MAVWPQYLCTFQKNICMSWHQMLNHWVTANENIKACNLTSSLGQFPLRGKTQQMASSIHYQGETFCMTCRPTFVFYGGTSAYDQLPYHVFSWNTKVNQIMNPFTPTKAGYYLNPKIKFCPNTLPIGNVLEN